MIVPPVGRALAAALLLLAPAAGAQEAPAPSSPAEPGAVAPQAADLGAEALAQARALLDAGRFEEAIVLLRPLARKDVVLAEVLFLLGLAAIEAAGRPGIAEAEREALLDEAITALRAMLVDRPDLVRVRLELARAFFLKGDDGLARRRFEQVLAGDPPPAVAANVNRFLSEIRARRRWSLSVGFALAPDSNIGAASDERIIYIFNLPFHRDAEELTTSGIGLAVWGGGEYQHPLGERLRLRAGIDAARREYPARNFDQFYLSVHAGPRWLMDARTEVSLLASARQVWVGPAPSHRDLGVRVEAMRRLGPRTTALGRASWHQREYRTRTALDGPILDVAFRGVWTITPTVRLEASLGYGRERPEAERSPQHQPASGGRCLGCPAGGLHRGRRRLAAVDGVPGQLVPVRTRRLLAPGPDADPARLGPPPVVHRVRLQPPACGDERGADDERPGPRLSPQQRRGALRPPVLTRCAEGGISPYS